jgi:DNA-binding beta-propeller fold protein YncE
MIRFRQSTRAGILLFLCGGLAAQKQPPPLELLAKVPLPGVHGRLDGLAADIDRSRLFVAASADGSVQIIDIRHDAVLQPLTGLTEPQSVVYVKSSDRLFVSSAGDGTLRAYEGDTLKFIVSLLLGPNAGAVRWDAVRDRIYAGYGDGALAVLDSAGRRLSDIALKAHPASFECAETPPRIFVNLPGSRSIGVVDGESGRPVADWPMKDGLDNLPMAIDEAHRRIFVACRRPARLLVLDMDSGAVVARLPAAGGADDLLYDPIHARLYALSGEGHITAYAQETADRYSAAGTIATVAGARSGLFVPEWNRLFLAVREFAGHPAEIRIYQPR